MCCHGVYTLYTRIRWLIVALQGQTEKVLFSPTFSLHDNWSHLTQCSTLIYSKRNENSKKKIEQKKRSTSLALWSQEMCNISYLHSIFIRPSYFSWCSTGVLDGVLLILQFPPVAMIYDRIHLNEWQIKCNGFRSESKQLSSGRMNLDWFVCECVCVCRQSWIQSSTPSITSI